SHLYNTIDTEMMYVKTLNHQALASLGAGLMPVAMAADNVIEAIEKPGNRVLGVQYRPELGGADSRVRRTFFKSLVDEAKKHRDGEDVPPPVTTTIFRSNPVYTKPAAPPPPPKPLTKEEAHTKRLEGLKTLNEAGYDMVRGTGGVVDEKEMEAI